MSQFLLEGFEPRVVVVTTDSKALPDPECSEPSRAGPGGAFHRADFDAPRAISRTRTIAPGRVVLASPATTPNSVVNHSNWRFA